MQFLLTYFVNFTSKAGRVDVYEVRDPFEAFSSYLHSDCDKKFSYVVTCSMSINERLAWVVYIPIAVKPAYFLIF